MVPSHRTHLLRLVCPVQAVIPRPDLAWEHSKLTAHTPVLNRSDHAVQAEAQNLQAQAHVHAHVQAEAQAQAQHLAVQAQAHAQAQAEASNHASHLKQMSSLGDCCHCDQGSEVARARVSLRACCWRLCSMPEALMTCGHAM